MTPILETTAVALVYILLLQPFYLLEILPFWGFLEEEKKKPFCRAWVALTVAETALTVGLVRSGLFPSEPAAYWAIGYIVWLPQFLLSFLATRKYWVGHLFILSFRILLSSCFYTFLRHFFLYFWPESEFVSMYFWQILFYGGECLIAFPILLRFFTRTFSHFQEAATRRFWRSTTIIPMLLAVDTLYVSVYDSQERYFDLLGARILLLIVVVLMMAAIRRGQQAVYDEIRAYEEKHQLQQQVVSAANYVKMSKESRQRLEAIYREKQDHLDQLLDLVRQKDRVGVLTYIEELGEEFNSTKLPQYCRNPLINAALTVYLSRAREEGIPTTISVDLPQDLTCSGDLSIVLSNLVENALIASEKQPEDRRNITVLARQQGDMLNILVKNLFDAPVLLDEEGLPVTKVKGHGIGMKSLARFRDKYGASVLCQQKDGWFLTYLQVDMGAKGVGD